MIAEFLRSTPHRCLPWKAKPVTSLLNNVLVRFSHDEEPAPSYPTNPGWINRCSIGNREVVGHGRNGVAGYTDNVFCPFPAIRYKALDEDMLLLRAKEKADWGSLSLQEKKTLYRASFRQTFAEFTRNNAYPDTEILGPLGLAMMIVAVALFYSALLKACIMPPLPTSMTREGWERTITKQIQLRWNPITGIASHWDYETERWRPGAQPWFVDYLPKKSPLREITPEQ